MISLNETDWLKLIRAPGFGPGTLLPALAAADNFEQLLRSCSNRQGLKLSAAIDQVDNHLIEQDHHWLEHPQHHLICWTDPAYPALLREIHQPPLALFISGDPDLLSLPQLAIVGSRHPTRSGLQNATAFAEFLARHGLAITSGLAAGIDASAHRGALHAKGKTIAVIGTGNDRVYPAENRELAWKIAEHGAIVSEFPPGTGPKADHFPRRNRLISGLSTGTLIVEATLKSGSLITASRALEQGREVFAIPGSIHSPQSKGCHRLIRDGARLVETAEDIVEDLAVLFQSLQPTAIDESNSLNETASASVDKLDPEYHKLLNCMAWDPISADEIITASGLPAGTVSSMLLLLELQGHVSSAPGGRFIRVQPDPV